MSVIYVGQRVRMTPETFGAGADRPGENARHTALSVRAPLPLLPGTVTYIHPSGRWYQVTFDIGVTECFFADPEPAAEQKKTGRPVGARSWNPEVKS